MALRTVIFVDGQNFRGNLRDFVFRSDPPHPTNPDYRLEEKHFLWGDFFSGVIDKFNAATNMQHQLVHVYWYHAATITPWRLNASAAQRVAASSQIDGVTAEHVINLARRWYDNERSYFERLREETFEYIQRNTDFLEFKYVGQYVVNPFLPFRFYQNADGDYTYLGTQQGEKGVDIGIAVDMIAKMPNYDAAVLVSGDADFLPVVRYVKDNLRYVYQFSVARGVHPSIQYLSPWLRGVADCFQAYDETEFLGQFLNRAAVPPSIVDAIGAHVAALTESAAPVQ